MALYRDVLRQQIWEFFCDDLQTCLEVSKIKQKDGASFRGGLNFTACLAIFSAIEMCSGYYKGINSNANTVSEFLTKYFSAYYQAFVDIQFSRYFYFVFRHGLSHQWSPMASAIDMNFYENYFIKKMLGQSEEILYLNIPTFFTITKNALKDYEKDLDKSDRLKTLFNKRYENIIRLDYQKMRILRGKLV